MALPVKVHCHRCGFPQWLASHQAVSTRRLQCPRCGHRAAPERVRLVRARARMRHEPELKLAGGL